MRRRLPLALASCFSAAVLLSPPAASGILALIALAALAFLLDRLVDRAAAAYGVAALATMPLFFVTAHVARADAGFMAASAVAFAGLGVAVLDARPEGDRRVRVVSLLLGVGGLVAGAFSRGALLGVAVPALAVGITWVLLGRRREILADACGAAALLTGVVALVVGVLAYRSGLAATVHPTFDATAHRLGHALFPWSGLLPLAFVALLSPPVRRGPLASSREEAARVLVLAGAVTALAAHAVVGPDTAPLTAPPILAAALALAARDLDHPSRREPGAGLRDPGMARAAGLAAALLTLLFARDLLEVPSRAIAAILPLHAGSPPGAAGPWLRAAALVFASVLPLAAFDRPSPVAPWSAAYLAWPTALRRAWDGQLAVALVAVQSTLISLALSVALRPARAAALGAVPRLLALHAFWALPAALLAIGWIPLAARDALHGLRRTARLPRGGLVIAAGAVAGALLAWGHYPALLAPAADSATHAPSATPAAAHGGLPHDH